MHTACIVTVAGTCYLMYTKEDYDAMPDFAVPAVLRSNCESLYLGLVRAVSCHSDAVLFVFVSCFCMLDCDHALGLWL